MDDPASFNGSNPDNNGSTSQRSGRTAFERFEDLTRRLVRVPKAEVDEKREKAKRKAKPASR